MKISDIKTYLVGNPWRNWLFVRVEADEGVYGIGADLNLDVVRAHPYHEQTDMNMWEEGWHFRRQGEKGA